jgi:hypothetical protein
MRGRYFLKFSLYISLGLNGGTAFAQATAPAAPIVSSERRGNSTCLERKALIYCLVKSDVLTPDATCPTRWMAYKYGSAFHPNDNICIVNMNLSLAFDAVTAKQTIKLNLTPQHRINSISTHQSLLSDHNECRAGFMAVAQSALPIFHASQPNQKVAFDYDECYLPASSSLDQALDDLRSIRNKFDSTLKSALEAAINTKTSPPEKP